MQGLTIVLKRSVNIALSLLAALSLSPGMYFLTPVQASEKSGHVLLAQKQANESKKQQFSGEGSGTLLAMLQSGKALGQCPLKHTDVRASVSGYVSRVSVRQTFQNSFKEKIEAVYTFPLPENAAVDEMTMRIGERVIKGNIKKREEARQIYETAKAQGHVASLLDQERTNIFTQSVANIEPGAKIEIEIKYVETLPYEAGAYTFSFPTVVGPRFIPGNTVTGQSGRGRLPDTDAVGDASKITPKVAQENERAGHDISIAVDINAGVPIRSINSLLHEVKVKQDGAVSAHIALLDKNTIPNKDFVLRWQVAGDKIQSGYLTHRDDKSGYFTLMLLPPTRVEPKEISPKEMVFLIDCSGSQSGPPLQKAKETMDYILDHMNAHDTFQIIAFSNTLRQLSERPLAASAEMKKKAREFMAKLDGNGGTWMAPAVEKVCAMPNDEHRLRIVTFMTDGYVGNDMEILGLVKKYRDKSRWFPFGTGNSVNRFLIDGIAREGGGEPEYVLLTSPGAVAGQKFYSRISTPVLTDLKLNFGGLDVKEVFPHDLADLWAQKPLYIKGRYIKPGAGTITLTGYAGGRPYRQELKVNLPEKQTANEVIKPMWARAKVDRLMSEDWFGAQRGAINSELKEEIIKTALDYHIMTQYTSFVAVEEKRLTRGGSSTTVDVPVEVPSGVSRASTVGESESLGRAPARAMGYGGGGGGGVGAGFSGAASVPPSVSGYAPSAPMPMAQSNLASAPRALPVNQPQSAFGLASPPSKKDSAVLMSKQESKAKVAESRKVPVQQPAAGDRQGKLDKLLVQLLLAQKNGMQPKLNGVEYKDGKVLVKITMSDLSPATLKKLKMLGMQILIVHQKDKTVIARIDTTRLEVLSEAVEVIKIEPAHTGK